MENDGTLRGSTSSSHSVNALGEAFASKPAETLAWLRSLPMGAERNRLMELALPLIGTREQALSVFATLPPEGQARTAGSIAGKFREEPDKACA